jgi:uncharacterized protein (TIGR03437 family)
MKQHIATVALMLDLVVGGICARQKPAQTRASKRSGSAALPRLYKTALATALCAAAFSPGLAQVPPASVLRIDTGNAVFYNQDTADVSRFATDPNVTTPVAPRNFQRGITIADIEAVNGQRVMGVLARAGIALLNLRSAPTPGQAIADTVRNAALALSFEILKSDGTPIGTIMASGLNGGVSPPGSPSNVTGGNFAVTGGTGAFLGARGQVVAEDPPSGVAVQRGASITEDPANRRRNGGGAQRWVVHLIPMSVPQIVTTAGGPAVFHSDFSLVTAAKPAKAGEVLIVEATGLGPTVPGVDPGQPFPPRPLLPVNSPVAVTVNGSPAEVINAIGWPGLVDTYRIDFRVPDRTTAGMASIQLTAAWVAGPDVRIAIQ